MIVVAQIFKHRPGNGVWAVTVAVMVAGLPDDHELLRMTDGQEPQNNLIQQAEHRRVCADTKRQRRHRNQGESRILRECSNAVPNILHEPVQPDSRANIANALYDLLVPLPSHDEHRDAPPRGPPRLCTFSADTSST